MLLINQQKWIPGILGGLGALSHVEFERKLIEQHSQRGACTDQDYPVWILINATNIPDRTDSIINQKTDCVPALVHYGKLLEAAGANFLVVICNTAHAFHQEVQAQLNISWLNLIDLTAEFVAENYPTLRNVGILATDGTIKTGLYEKSLQQMGLNVIYHPLHSPLQQQIMEAIYHPQWGIKSTGNRVSLEAMAILERAIAEFETEEVELIIAGCTELAIAFNQMNKVLIPWIDPLDVLAQITLDRAFFHQSC